MKSILRKVSNLLLSFAVLTSMLTPGFQPDSVSAQAQPQTGIQREYNAESGRVTLIRGADNQPVSVLGPEAVTLTPEAQSLALVQHFAKEFGLSDPANELKLSEIDQPDAERAVSKYQQVYQGVPVMAGELIVNANKAGELISMNGEVSQGLALDIQPELTVDAAIDSAKQGMVKWYGGEAKDYTSTQSSLWIFDETLLRPSIRPANLVWRIEMVSAKEGAPIRELVLVDAKTGNVTFHINQVDTAWGVKEKVSSRQDIPLTPITEQVEIIQSSAKIINRNTFSSNKESIALAGTIWYVATSGNDANSCTATDSPCLTINGAIGKAASGDSIKVAVGTYTGSGAEVVLINKSITLSGGWDINFDTNGDLSTIDGQAVRRGITVSGSPVFVDRFLVQNGFYADSGGGVYAIGALTINNSIVHGNKSRSGAGIYNSGSLLVVNTAISGNRASWSGSGVFNNHGAVTLNNSSVNNNFTEDPTGGTGIWNSFGSFELNNSTVSNNSQLMGIINEEGNFNINNSTISSNRSGVYNWSNSNGVVNMQNSILSNNTSLETDTDCIGIINSGGYNLIERLTPRCGFTVKTGDIINTNPNLGQMIHSPGYIPLLPNSSAIDAGNPSTCLLTDQRGMPRPQGNVCDIGAYEYTLPGAVSILEIVDGSNQRTGLLFPFSSRLTVAVLDENGSPITGASVTFSAPSSGASGTFMDTGTSISTAVSNSGGIAISPELTANDQIGDYQVTASVAGSANTVMFTLTNVGPFYVATTGNDSNTCISTTAPCLTINGAINKAGPGEFIKVAKGTYTDPGPEVVLIDKSITLSGGWDSSFTSQNGASIIDGENARTGIHAALGTVFVENFIIENGKSNRGGGISIGDTGESKFTLTNSTLRNNLATEYGGGVFLGFGTLYIVNSTISGNHSNVYGGGVSDSTVYQNSVIIQNSTIVYNTAYDGGGVNRINGRFSVYNTIIANNYSSILHDSDCSGGIDSAAFSIFGVSKCSVTSDINNFYLDPHIDENLTGAMLTHRLMTGSPAINAGTSLGCPATDQEGTIRPSGGSCDIGSVEYIPNGKKSINIYSGQNKDALINTTFGSPLVVLVTDENDTPVAGIEVAFVAPILGASGTFSASGTDTTFVTTDGDGIASSSTLIANSMEGSYNVSVSADGYSSALFQLTNYSSSSDLKGRYVSTVGSDTLPTNCNSILSPCLTINKAIQSAVSGDRIYITAGTYNGNGEEVVLINKSIILSGGWDTSFTEQSGVSVIDGQSARRGITTTATIGAITVNRLIIRNGFSAMGGGIYNGSTLMLSDSIVKNNISDWMGGGVYNFGALTIDNTAISENSAGQSCCSGGDGGGILNNGGSVILNNSSVNGNTTINGYSGSGIYNTGIFQLNNSTVSGNRGAESIYNGYSLFSINNSTISGNKNGGIDNNQNYGTVSMQNSILANNTTSEADLECSGSIISAGHNLIGNTSKCTFSSSTGDLVNVDPLLNSFLIGSPGYYTLSSDSPAIDAGNPATCLATDERGIPRPQGNACDMGAYEYTSPGTAVSFGYLDGSNQRATTGLAYSKSLAVYVLDNQGSPVPGASVTFTAPSSGASGTFSDSGSGYITILSNESGLAIAPIFTANDQPGDFAVTATTPNLTGTVIFSLTNVLPWLVSPTGNDANTCNSVATPCLTINGAINKATSGDVIKVADGTYTGTGSKVVQIDKDITIDGGWNADFSRQNGLSIINGELARVGINVDCFIAVHLNHLNITNGQSSTGFLGGINTCGNLTITNSAIRNSYGGINISSGNVILNNVTISNNFEIGVYISSGALSINNTTISNNFSSHFYNSVRGGIHIYHESIIVTIQNSIVANNGDHDCYGTIISKGYNLIGNLGDYAQCTIVLAEGDQVGTSTAPIYPRLAPLQDNGGSTFTHALLFSSPAINAGNPALPGSGGDACAAADQRGVARPVGARCDIGAYEGTIPWTPVIQISTYTAERSSTLPGTFLCDQTQPNCTSGFNPHADAAHKYAQGTYNLYAAKYLRDSIDNNGMAILSTVRYCSPSYPCPYTNAFWSGTQMVYGDAYGFPLADDVVAHELTHGVTQYESNLFYFYQSGAINESLSDVWGEYYDQTNGLGNDSGSVRWLMGEDVSGTTPARNMSNPPAYSDPDKMSSTLYYEGDLDNGGVHTNSGVNNKAVFLMVDGGSFGGIRVSALGWDKTAAIYYEAQTHLLSSGADYSDLYYALQQACINLTGQLGITATDCHQVKSALDAVEMYAQPAVNFNPDAPVCASGYWAVPYFQDDMESGTGKWNMTGYWSLQDGYASSSTHMLYGDDYYPYSDSSATMAAGVTLPAASNIYLHFKHAFAFEFYQNEFYDGGVLEYSLNNGAYWADASPFFVDGKPYNGTIMNYNGTANALKGRTAFIADSHGYVSSRYNLTSLGGQNVKFRWRFATDNSYYYLGWMLDNVQIYTCEVIPAPVVNSIARADTSPTNATNVDYKVTFSQSVTGVDPSDFSLTTSGVLGATMSGVSGMGSLYTVSVNTGSGSGTIKLNLVDNDSITNGLANPLGGAGSGNGNFTGGETYTITKIWIFGDVPSTYWAHSYIERLYNAGITGGCSTIPLYYCPANTVTRAQMAVFLLRGIHGSNYTPPPAGADTGFADVPADHPMAAWIKQLAAEGITGGCGNSSYCPDAVVTRAQMAVFLLRSKYTSAYTPPPADGDFTDVPLEHSMAAWIEQLAAEGITGGCGAGTYCPDKNVTRDQMAIFLVRTFNLP